MRSSVAKQTATAMLALCGRALGDIMGRKNPIIPIDSFKCQGHLLNETEVKRAEELAVSWGEKYRVGSREVFWWESGETTWWICNCKLFAGDPVVREEFDDVLDILEHACGYRYGSGWVWSSHWDKGFNLDTVTSRESVDDNNHHRLCPPNCLSEIVPRANPTAKP